jgi:phosphoglycerol transferase MdoB-like AlkP superfamily enzyme
MAAGDTSGNENPETREGSRSLLGRRDWIYLLGLLVPFIVYDLALKAILVVSQPENPGFLGGFGLMRSDILFNAGYVLFWVGLFAVARRGAYRWIVVVLFHVVTMCVALITTTAYQYFKTTGSTLDSGYVYLLLTSPEGTGEVIASELTPGILILLLAIVAYAILGPLLVTRLVSRWRGFTAGGARTARVSWLRVTGVVLAAYAMFSFSLIPGGSTTGASRAFSKDAFVNVVTTAAEVAESDRLIAAPADPAVAAPPPEASLVSTGETEKRNVVMIFLESTRAGATTPYNQQGLDTTPFLDELARDSLLVHKAYTVVPHTHNALTATNCGVEPPLDHWGTMLLGARDDSVPSTCLPDLLQEEGYNSAYFMSQSSDFERSPKILENLGYDEFYPIESMDTEGFEQTNYFGYEDEVMLEPSKEWLRKNGDEPFLATYLTSAPHHDYLAPDKRYGSKKFSDNDLVNNYLNSVRNQDFFLKGLFEQYKKLGLYEDTVFVILGDHGEGFGEHGRYQHDNTIYEEGLRIPMLIHDPQQFQGGATLEGPVTQLDVLPTVTDLLGYGIEGGAYGGSSLLGPISKDRTLMFSCWNDKGCLARLQGMEKYIYHFDDKPEEVFDLSKDPAERQNLAGQRSSEELEKRRREVLEWRAKVNSKYGMQPATEE